MLTALIDVRGCVDKRPTALVIGDRSKKIPRFRKATRNDFVIAACIHITHKFVQHTLRIRMHIHTADFFMFISF